MPITANRPDALRAARRAIDEKAIRARGPLAAIIAARSEASAVRRASLVLGWHRIPQIAHRTDDLIAYAYPKPVAPHDVLAALGTWRLLNRRAA